MASLARIAVPATGWVLVSGEMVSGEKYQLANTYPQNVLLIAEADETPTSTTSAVSLGALEAVTWKFDGTPVWAAARVVDRVGVLGVDVILIAES